MINEIRRMQNKAEIQQINTRLIQEKKLDFFVKREDLLHPEISGNKWRKLFYNLQAAKAQSKNTLISFGGAYSNHIHALAAAGALFRFKTIGIIRGERPKILNASLRFAQQKGMLLYFVSRRDYKDKNAVLSKLDLPLADSYILPEGGTNMLAIKGCQEIITELKDSFDYYCVCCGTGGTIAGIITALDTKTKVLGFSVLKGNFLTKEVENLVSEFGHKTYPNWEIKEDYHFGGYAKYKMNLIEFINAFKANHGIPLDPIYTGKMMYGIMDLIEKDYFPKATRILAIHTGGLQGIAGFNERFGGILI